MREDAPPFCFQACVWGGAERGSQRACSRFACLGTWLCSSLMSNGAFDLFVKGRVLHCKTRPFSCQNAAFYGAKGRIWHFILFLLVLRSDDGKIPASHQAFCLSKVASNLFMYSSMASSLMFLSFLLSVALAMAK